MIRSPAPRLRRRATPSSIVRVGALVAVASTTFSACDLPTSLPRVETRFVIPGESTTLGANQLLPAGITAAGTSFRLHLEAASIPSTTLAEMCGAPCTAFHGQMVPKPGFTATIPVTVPLPDAVESATLAGGNVAISLTHNFGFDPLQPGGRTEDGSITVTVRSGAATLGTAALTGAFPSGTTRTAAVLLQPGVITDEIDVAITINSPAGGTGSQHWVRIDTNASLSGSVVPGDVLVSEARVSVPNQTVTETSSIDLSDIDETMQDRVVRGAIVLAVDNPLAVAGTLVLRLSTGATTITKTVQIAAGATSQRVEFTGAELRSLLGNNVSMTLQGSLGSTAPITVRPGDEITVSSLLDLTFEIGGTD